MSNLFVNLITSQNNLQLDSDLNFSKSEYVVLPKGTTAQRPSNPNPGSIRFNTTTRLVEQFNGTAWVSLNAYSPGRGVFGGGTSPTYVNTLDYINIATTSAAIDFGDLSQTKRGAGACSSATRGVWANGILAPQVRTNLMEYITFSSTGNSINFGESIRSVAYNGACSSSTRGLYAGGFSPETSAIAAIIFSTTGNAIEFGEIRSQRFGIGGLSSSTRAIFAGGSDTAGDVNPTSIIEYVNFSSDGVCSNFGNLTATKSFMAGCSSSTHGVFAGQREASATTSSTEYLTIFNLGNSILFAQLSSIRFRMAACSSGVRGVFGGGQVAPTIQSSIEYITITSNQSALSFGNLTVARDYPNACSDNHGGLA